MSLPADLFTIPPWAKSSHLITTPRLILRTVNPILDVKASLHIRSDPLNNPFGGCDTIESRNEEEHIALLEHQVLTTASGGSGFLVIILKPDANCHEGIEDFMVEDGVMIGLTGFARLSMENDSDEKEVFIGYIAMLIDRHFTRNGYAREALCAVFEYGFETLAAGRLIVDTSAPNIPMITLMEEMGCGKGTEWLCKVEGESIRWEFTYEDWERVKNCMKMKGQWPL